KIKIIDTVWDITKYTRGTENAHQTDLAKEACSGDWLFYIQADEVLHEKYLDEIVNKCNTYLDDDRVEGFLFKYVHFWGDYNHFQNSHGWYPKEIRIIKNRDDIHSWESAQSFRRIPEFDGIDYRQQEGTYKLNVIELDAKVFHYGWVRPPEYMQSKQKSLDTIHKGKTKVDSIYQDRESEFDYGPLRLAQTFNGSHPKVMEDWIGKFNWQDKLYKKGPIPNHRPLFKHEKLKYRLISFIEQKILKGNSLFGFSNYNILK
ncbi:MAG: hypothetical protein HRT72_06560, partial [Flavobacteriales bacterium]|nr:hypothetical protein [Flavobacteriales bacterium]